MRVSEPVNLISQQERRLPSNSWATRLSGIVTGAVLLGSLLALGGCGSSSTAGSTTSSTGSESSSTTSATKPVARHVLVATFADNGGTLTVQVHDRIRVVLAGTSWTQSTSDAGVLRATGKATTLSASSGCVTGQGCGSVTVFYEALKTGNAQVLGARGNCQNAAQTCTTGLGAFRLKVVVMK
jgi:hypothetical protein